MKRQDPFHRKLNAKMWGGLVNMLFKFGIRDVDCAFKLIKKVKPDTLQTTIFLPLRKTELYEKVVNDGIYDPSTPMATDYYEKSLLRVSGLWQQGLKMSQFILMGYNKSIINWFGLFVLSLPLPMLYMLNKFIRLYNLFKKIFGKK